MDENEEMARELHEGKVGALPEPSQSCNLYGQLCTPPELLPVLKLI